jgi:predicted MFS family arabinose efflux permease
VSAQTYRQLLGGNASFRKLWAGQVVSELGNWFNFIAGLGLVRAVSAAAPEATAIMLVARLAPFALFAPLAGAFVDRWSRRTVMIVSDCARALFALGFLFVRGPEDLWIAYSCTVISTVLAAFFEAAKNASLPSVAGDNGLLAGNALMFSSRFLLMTVGAALGGMASAGLGYQIAFTINALSFAVSAWSVWLIPDSDTRSAEATSPGGGSGPGARRPGTQSYLKDIGEGWSYILSNPLVAAIIGANILWATGGGATFLLYDRLGGVVYAASNGLSPDGAVAVLYAASGFGLFIGMLLARRIGAHVELHGITMGFIGWMLFLHGIVFAFCGVAPTLLLCGVLVFLSRALIGVEFAVQETLLMRLVPDSLRGRVSTTDRASEILVMSLSTVVAGWALMRISVATLAVIAGLLSGLPGFIWLLLTKTGRLKLPQQTIAQSDRTEAELVFMERPNETGAIE